ncbi:MAG: O-antigen ligase family protein [Anaerolineaceae bacterium]|nr:O-antigen ligase family protein [Anaerolineaceae bacterium]
MGNQNSTSVVRYYLQEIALFFFLTYFALIGGTLNGLTTFRLNLVSSVLIFLTGMTWFAVRLLRRRTFPATRLDAAWLAMLTVYAAATLFSKDPRRSAIELTQLIAIALAYYLLVDLLRAGWSGDLLVKTILLTSLPPILLSLIELMGWYSSWIRLAGWSNPLPPTAYRISALILNPNYSAAYFNLLLPLGIVGILRSRSRILKFLLGMWTLSMLALLFLTSSRGGWLAMHSIFAALIVYITLNWRQEICKWWNTTRRRGVWIGVAALVVFGAILVDIAFFAWQTRSTTSAGTGLQLSARSSIWSVAWQGFLARPLVGSGPFTFATEFMKSSSIPDGLLLAHAHNHLLNTAADAGLFGVAALAGMLGMVGWLAYRRWKTTQGGDRLVLGGILASLAGLAVHSQFDTPAFSPGIGVLIVALLAWLAAPELPSFHPRGQKTAAWGLLGSFLLLIGALGYNLLGYQPAIRGVQASLTQNWAQAADDYDLAAARDPRLAFNWFQAGYAHGMLALNPDGTAKDCPELQRALAAYQAGFGIEPIFATNWANAGLLQWASGDQTNGIESIRRAADTAPAQLTFRLTLGRMLEVSGKLDDANIAYQKVLKARPDWTSTYFFRATSFRKQVVAQYQRENPLPVPTKATPDPSEQQLRETAFASEDGGAIVESRLRLGQYYFNHSDPQKAIQAYTDVVFVLGRTSSFGIGNVAYSPYGWSVFNRESIGPDLLPGMDMVLYTDEVVNGMLNLASAYQQTGDPVSAAQIYQRILEVAPDTQAAWIALAGSPK